MTDADEAVYNKIMDIIDQINDDESMSYQQKIDSL